MCVLMIGVANIDQPLHCSIKLVHVLACSPCTCCALNWAVLHVLAMRCTDYFLC